MRKILPALVLLAVCSSAYAWEAESPTDQKNSTHLWIVNRAVDILGRHPELASAKSAYKLLTNATCKTRWQLGLIDADFKAVYNDGNVDIPYNAGVVKLLASGATWESHFWDPDTGLNWLGGTDVGYSEALTHLSNAKYYLGRGDTKNGCYELGLSMHFVTDLTQPMHAANFSATDYPIKLHSNLETWAMKIQSRYAITDWSGAPSPSTTPAAVIDDTARTAKSIWSVMWGALWNAYSAKHCFALSSYYFDFTSCWQGDASVDNEIGSALITAQEATAAYLYSLDL